MIAEELAKCDIASLSSKVSESTGRSTREVVSELIDGLVRDFPPASPGAEILARDTPSEGVSEGVSDRGSSTSLTETETATTTETETETADGDTPPQTAFDDWWAHWPRKKSIGDARKAFPKALRAAGLPALIDGADAYSAWVDRNRVEDQYVVGPGRWLREERWADDLIDRGPQNRSRTTERIDGSLALIQQLEQEKQWKTQTQLASSPQRQLSAPTLPPTTSE